MSKPPEYIYLQYDPNDEYPGEYPENWNTEDITWCVDKIGSDDIEYVRSEKLTQAEKLLEETKEKVECIKVLAQKYFEVGCVCPPNKGPEETCTACIAEMMKVTCMNALKAYEEFKG